MSVTCASVNFKPKKLRFGLNLPDAAALHLRFLEAVNEHPFLCDRSVVLNAIRRYEQMWLPLAAANNSLQLAAPLDIEWIWHCHMLSPVAYEKDCRTVTGVIVDHRLMTLKERKQSLEKAKYLWQRRYFQEPFDTLYGAECTGNDCQLVSKLSYDLLSAVARQRMFYHQVSLPHYKDSKFLEASVLRYKKFIFLKRRNPDLFLVPCYDIDLIWHTHQLHPHAYKSDTERLLGRLFNHDDTVIDRSTESKLSKADLKTRELWKFTFHEQFFMHGAMYRGDRQTGNLNYISPIQAFGVSTKRTKIRIDRIVISGLPPAWDNFFLKLYCLSPKNCGQSIVSLNGPRREWHKTNLAVFTFDTRRYKYLKISLKRRVGVLCYGHTDTIVSHNFDLMSLVERHHQGFTLSEDIRLSPTCDIKVTVQGTVQAPKQGSCVLSLWQGNYETCVVPEQYEQLWGSVSSRRLPNGTENKCYVASHR